jgi:outer membrane protein assembly factor BamB
MIAIKGLKIALVIAAFYGPAHPLQAGQGSFTYFRSDAGLQTGTGSLPENLEAPEALRWRVPLEAGHSTPALRDGKIFLTAYEAESKQLTICALSEKNGELIWRAAIKPEQIEQTHPIGSPATATPACDGERLFVFFGSAGLLCYDLAGKKLWEQRSGPFRDEYGAGSSPILCDD